MSSSTLYTTEPQVSSSIVKGSLRKICILPAYVDPSEWVATITLDFVKYIAYFYEIMGTCCTQETCPTMNAGSVAEYFWMDSQKNPTRIPASQYIHLAFGHIHQLTEDENIFPSKVGNPFLNDFPNHVKLIWKYLFRILAHIYMHHYDYILKTSCESHLNSLFAHFICFAKEFDLLDKKEISPLTDLIQEFDKLGVFA